MRKWKLAGYRNVSYKSRNTGNQVDGQELYLVADPVTPDIVGVETKTIWLGGRVAFRASADSIGIYVHIGYDERGHVEAVYIVE